MKSIFKVRRITLKGIESKTEQHFLSFDQAPPAVNKQMSSALASLPVCLAGELQQVCLQVLVQPWLSLSCWAALGSHPWPELPLHPLPSLGHTCLSLGQGRLLAELGLQEGPPSLAAARVWRLLPSMCDVFPFDVLGAEGCLIPDCVVWELACAQLSPLCDLWQMKQGAIASPSSFSDTLCSPTKGPQLCWEAPICFLSGAGFPGMDCVSAWHCLTQFSFSLQHWWCALSNLVSSPLEEARESCNKNISRQQSVLHPPHSLIPPLVLISFLPGSIILSKVG